MTKNIGVLGSGVMGGGIAQMFAEKDFNVLLWDVEASVAEGGFEKIKKRLMKSVEKGKIDSSTAVAICGRIKPVARLQQMSEADLVIEAVVEDMNIKAELYRKLEEVISSEAIVGTNTSSLSVEALSAHWQKPERFLGIHFFNPPTKLELVELILPAKTSLETTRKVKEILQKCGKTMVDVKDSPGFIVNRLLIPMINEAAKLLDNGTADVSAIDTAMRLGALHPAGPLEVADLIGLDVCQKILERMAKALQNPFYEPAKAINERVDSGCLGRKSGAGFYKY
ncbi:MAG: hypothetical protein A2X49_00835 [Lentisphaerae bacterium GWF2_52_8]|nr:MAG: hypothetical protein A2X49_00835 [Lentisphaerae bacterium GWF2_52_8]